MKWKCETGKSLVGPMIICKKNGILPFYLAKTIAYAFLYDDNNDTGSRKIKTFLVDHGINKAIQHLCGLHYEKDLTGLKN